MVLHSLLEAVSTEVIVLIWILHILISLHSLSGQGCGSGRASLAHDPFPFGEPRRRLATLALGTTATSGMLLDMTEVIFVEIFIFFVLLINPVLHRPAETLEDERCRGVLVAGVAVDAEDAIQIVHLHLPVVEQGSASCHCEAVIALFRASPSNSTAQVCSRVRSLEPSHWLFASFSWS